MNEKSIHERIKEKRDNLYEVHASLALHMSKELTPEQRAKGVELQDRLEYRVLQYEEQLLDEKIDTYKKLLEAVR